MINSKNVALAERFVFFDKTVAIINQNENYEQLVEALQNLGYFVRMISENELCEKTEDRIGSILIIPSSEKINPKTAPYIERYRSTGGKILFLGGPLFGKRDILEKYAIIEGISPQYKIFSEGDCDNFIIADKINVTKELKTNKPVEVISPAMRSKGEGFNMERKNRLIPLVSIKKEGQRDNGIRGTAAYIVLSDTTGHLTPTWGSRAGIVSPTVRGSAIGAIGIAYKTLIALDGGIQLISDIVNFLNKGIYFFESGADKYVVKNNEKFKIGAKILSTNLDYLNAKCIIKICNKNKVVYEKEENLVLNAQQYTSFFEETVIKDFGEYRVLCELYCNEKLIDKTTSELFVSQEKDTEKNNFVTHKGENFYLNNKIWYMHGMNYWPLYHVGLELSDYWMGAFDKALYIPSEVEKDLAFIEEQGINNVAVRIENTDMDRVVQPFKDFLYRCKKHNLKVSLSFPNITNPLYFQKNAFEKFMKLFDVANNSTIFALDISWEVGTHPFEAVSKDKFQPHWENWLIEQYGSLEEAEKYTGVVFDRDEGGNLACPDCTNYGKDVDENERKQLTLYRYFADDYISRTWNKAVREIKKIDGNHLIMTRAGCICDDLPNSLLAHAQKHLDIVGLEGYTIELSDTGLCVTIAQTEAARFISKNKPITWVEYGISLVGASGYAVGTKMKWNREKLSPLDEKFEEQRRYQEQFDKAMKFTGVKGSMPWYYCGGFRSTECSDAGYIGPNGVMRPCSYEYKNAFEKGLYGAPSYGEKEIVKIDLDKTANGWPSIVFGKGRFSRKDIDLLEGAGKKVNVERTEGTGLVAAKKAYKENKGILYVTSGTGTTSENTPLEAAANLKYQGRGPLKYLNAEFNRVVVKTSKGELEVENNKTISVKKGEKIFISAEIGNAAEAKWLAPENESKKQGYVFLKVNDTLFPIAKDTERFEDATAQGFFEIKGTEDLILTASAYNRCTFGEKFIIHLIEE